MSACLLLLAGCADDSVESTVGEGTDSGGEIDGEGETGDDTVDSEGETGVEVGQWREAGALAVGRASMGYARLDGDRLLLVGGSSSGVALDSTEIYDASTESFTSGPTLHEARSMPAVAVLPDGRVLIAGGVDASGAAMSSCEIYDPATEQISPTSPMSVARARHKVDALGDGRVWATGGSDVLDIEGDPLATLAGAHVTTELFDAATDSWVAGPSFETPRLVHATAVLDGGDVLVSGGLTSVDGVPSLVASSAVLSLATETLSAVDDMPTGAAEHTMSRLSDGRVLATGGGEFSMVGFEILASAAASLYDPDTGSWSLVADMPTGRAGHVGLQLLDGSTLCPSGDSGSLFEFTPTAAVDRFDPVAGSWTTIAPLPTAVVGYAAFVGASGDVFVIGGFTGTSENDRAWRLAPG